MTVKSDSVIRVKRNAYSVSSKYIGLHLEVRIHQDHLELWYRNECVERMPRQFGCGKEAIDFRHVIDSLVRKPGAFINYKYVNHMYPTTRFRMAYDQLLKSTTEASAVKQYLKLLYAAKHEGLDLVDDVLRWFLTERPGDQRRRRAEDGRCQSNNFPLRPRWRSRLPIFPRLILCFNTRRCTMSKKPTGTTSNASDERPRRRRTRRLRSTRRSCRSN